MKICIVTPSFNGGGAERIAVNLANYYAEQGHELIIVAFKASGPFINQVSEKVNVIDLNSRARYVFFKLLSALKSQQPDLVLSVIRDSNILVGITALFFNSQIIFREANTLAAITVMPALKKWVYLFLMSQTYKRAHKVIANSFDTQADLLNNNIVKQSKVTVIGNPVLSTAFEALLLEPVRHKWLGDSDYKTILNVGRLHKQKNQAHLIKTFKDVFAQQQNARLIIVGEGVENANIVSLIAKLDLTAFVDIVLFQRNPYTYYKAADVFVLTSDWEGFGNVIVEAMASETPVISTDCPGGPKMILNNGEFGRLVQPNSVIKLAEAIIQEIQTPTMEEDIEKAKLRAMEFSLPRVAEMYLEVLDK